MFFQLILAMFLGLTCPSNSNNTGANQGTAVSANDEGPGTGGNTGQLPPPKANS